ncbi:MAG TPA: hypothetical protein VMT46_12390 [Anaerolineaceae bacterium]|nr:hypothetical protein [Anaerolineaceae bacterium]
MTETCAGRKSAEVPSGAAQGNAPAHSHLARPAGACSLSRAPGVSGKPIV